jgi:hypothetical protein
VGTSFLAIHLGVESIPPLMLMGVRCDRPPSAVHGRLPAAAAVHPVARRDADDCRRSPASHRRVDHQSSPFSAYAWLLNVAPVGRESTHASVNPLIAVAVGSAVAGEPINASLVVRSAVIATGVAMVRVSPSASL